MLAAQALVFGVLLPLWQLIIERDFNLGVSIVFFFAAIFFGLFIILLAFFVGFPVFRKLISIFNFNYFSTVFLSGMSSCFVVAATLFLLVQIQGLLNGQPFLELKAFFGASIPIMGVGAVACLIYWAGTKNLNNKFQNPAEGGSDATDVAPV